MAQTTLELATDFVLAQMQVQVLSIDDMRKVLQHTHSSLMTRKAQEAGKGAWTPPVRGNWRTSITKRTVTCLDCGARLKQLSVRHLRFHDLDAQSYRAKYGIPRSQPLAAKATTALRQQVVQETRPWEKAPRFVQAQRAKAGTATAAKNTGRAQRKGTSRAKA
jgi:predicted transcriptional regulator